MTIDLCEINATHIGEQVDFKGIIEKVRQPEIRMKKAVFVCKTCLRIHEILQNILETEPQQPIVCQECGCKTFQLELPQSTFATVQFIEIGMLNTLQTIKACTIHPAKILDLGDIGEPIHVFGKVSVMQIGDESNFELVVLCSDEQGE